MTENSVPATLIGPTLADMQIARGTVAAVAQVTPVETSRFLSELLGSPVLLKCENLQRTGSYKIRGAFNRLSALSTEERSRGVVAASAGNHAQGVALGARELGIEATIFMPTNVPLPKLEATRDYGAQVVLSGSVFGETLAAAAAFAEETGAIFIPPYDHPAVVAGQSTIAFELLEQVPDLDTVVVPIGGGGLISGIASAFKQLAAAGGRPVRVIGVQAENAASYIASLEAGTPVNIPFKPTIADGIAVYRPGELNYLMIQDAVDEIVTVSEDDAARALLVLMERAKLVVEPAGAVSVAALLAGKISGTGTTVAILSGGNIDPLLMQRVISHGLAASDRYLTMRVMLMDRPGELARVATILAGVRANVIEVLHTQHGPDLQITEVELDITVETRGPAHVEEVLAALRADGYEPKLDKRRN
ncbi:threonine ammonia-lyase [Microterricola viridarii]|uniref:L-threonine dehydratase catabolic TdcB n=1 Tax=Microterricola viridarii TaxID=412690 RepID=A0A0X8E3H9_9MICO|nr:threonine ammonia-lyase [Microterricola viridarii]AMB59062.1 threonine dehydratase [Microterricola viridarii]